MRSIRTESPQPEKWEVEDVMAYLAVMKPKQTRLWKIAEKQTASRATAQSRNI